MLYTVLGLATLGLSQMIGLAAPVWPAAGIAFAAAVRCGWRALPGVFIGSVGVNAIWLTRLDEPAPHALFVATAVGVGAVLEAAAGSTLVHRFVGPIRQLDTPRAVLLTLSLGALLACTIAPTIGVAAQLIAGLLSTDQAPFGWLTWWTGDAIGVIVFGPLVLMLLPSQAEYWSGRRWKIAVPSLLIFAIVITAILQNVAQERNRTESAVEKLGAEAASDLTRYIAVHQEVLEGLHGLLDTSDDLTEKQFNAYTNDLLNRFPNLQALSWNPLVTAADLPAFEKRQRAQPGLENFTVTQRDANGKPEPVSPRPAYVVVAYIEPMARNRNALGFDIYSNPARAAAIDTARDTGRPVATPPIDLVQESGSQKGMLALLPVYTGGTDPGSVPARRAALRGFVVGVYRLGDLLAETFRGTAWDSVDITLVDVTDRAHPIGIADLPRRDTAPPDGVNAAPTATAPPLDVYGRSWEITVRRTSSAFNQGHGGLLAVLLLAALAVTLLLEAFVLVLSGMDSLARRLRSELGSADRYVTSILPRDVDAPVAVSARYVPSEELGGDSFDHRWIDDDHLVVYLVDVSGHGIAPAMLTVSVHNLLRSGTLDDDTLRDPGKVLTELNRLFQMDQHAGHYFTIWYGVYQPSTHTLRYAGAGHPPAIVMAPDGSDPVRLPSESVPIGLLTETSFETVSYALPADSVLVIYSDGAFDLTLPDGRRWTIDDFIDTCAQTARSPHWTLDDLYDQLQSRSTTGHFDDDCTLVRVAVGDPSPLPIPGPEAVALTV